MIKTIRSGNAPVKIIAFATTLAHCFILTACNNKQAETISSKTQPEITNEKKDVAELAKKQLVWQQHA